jgi:hypothetical protein
VTGEVPEGPPPPMEGDRTGEASGDVPATDATDGGDVAETGESVLVGSSVGTAGAAELPPVPLVMTGEAPEGPPPPMEGDRTGEASGDVPATDATDGGDVAETGESVLVGSRVGTAGAADLAPVSLVVTGEAPEGPTPPTEGDRTGEPTRGVPVGALKAVVGTNVTEPGDGAVVASTNGDSFDDSKLSISSKPALFMFSSPTLLKH